MRAGQAVKKLWSRHALRVIVIIFLLVLALLMALSQNLEQVILDMAHARAHAMAVDYMNEAVGEIMRSGVTYEDLIAVRTDSAGRVTMLQANTVRMNDLAIQVALKAQASLDGAQAQFIYIPLGAALGLQFLAGAGPEIAVKIVPVGSVSAAFSSEFESAGINQTRHKIYLVMHTQVQLVIPTGGRKIAVDNQVSIAESIIVGEVPQSFVEVPEMSDALNFLP